MWQAGYFLGRFLSIYLAKVDQNRIIEMIENIMFSHAPRSIDLVNETPEAVKRSQGL